MFSSYGGVDADILVILAHSRISSSSSEIPQYLCLTKISSAPDIFTNNKNSEIIDLDPHCNPSEQGTTQTDMVISTTAAELKIEAHTLKSQKSHSSYR
jgi:hypothetical protein